LTFVNKAYCRFFGKSRQQLIGRSLLELFPPDQHESILTRIRGMIRHPRTISFERKLISADGVEQWQKWFVYPAFDEAGHVVEFQALSHDVTERRKAEDSLR